MSQLSLGFQALYMISRSVNALQRAVDWTTTKRSLAWTGDLPLMMKSKTRCLCGLRSQPKIFFADGNRKASELLNIRCKHEAIILRNDTLCIGQRLLYTKWLITALYIFCLWFAQMNFFTHFFFASDANPLGSKHTFILHRPLIFLHQNSWYILSLGKERTMYK